MKNTARKNIKCFDSWTSGSGLEPEELRKIENGDTWWVNLMYMGRSYNVQNKNLFILSQIQFWGRAAFSHSLISLMHTHSTIVKTSREKVIEIIDRGICLGSGLVL